MERLPLLRKIALLLLGVIALLVAWIFMAWALAIPWEPARLIWYLSDDAPPQVNVLVPTETVRGVITAVIVIRDQGPYLLEGISLDGRPLSPTLQLPIDTASLPDGEHALVIQARDLSRRRNLGQATAILHTENTPPTITLTLDPPLPAQGHALFLRLGLSKAATVTASYDGQPLPLIGPQGLQPANYSQQFCQPSGCWAMLGFAPDAPLVTHTLTFTGVDRLGNRRLFTSTFHITATRFPVERIVLPPDRAGLTNTVTETRRLETAFATLSPARLWEGPFMVPVSGEVTAPFGEARAYDGGPVASHHSGVDLAALPNTPVAAAATGRILLAERFSVQGNAVLVDHGLGLVSAYYHLAVISVKPGDLIRQGQTLGLVGNTGLSTGPHLHWEVRLRGVPVDPWEWTKRAVP